DLMRQDRGNGARAALTLKALTELEKRLGGMRTIERARLPGLDGRRADTIYIGAVVLRTALELSGASEATLCETALRQAILAQPGRDGPARGARGRPRAHQPARHPARRRVPRPAPAQRHGAGPALPLPRGPRHPRGQAGHVGVPPDPPPARPAQERRRAARV